MKPEAPSTALRARYRVRALDGRVLAPEETAMGRALHREAVADNEYLFTRPNDGRDVRVRASAAPIRDGSGAVVGAVAAFSEIAP